MAANGQNSEANSFSLSVFGISDIWLCIMLGGWLSAESLLGNDRILEVPSHKAIRKMLIYCPYKWLFNRKPCQYWLTVLLSTMWTGPPLICILFTNKVFVYYYSHSLLTFSFRWGYHLFKKVRKVGKDWWSGQWSVYHPSQTFAADCHIVQQGCLTRFILRNGRDRLFFSWSLFRVPGYPVLENTAKKEIFPCLNSFAKFQFLFVHFGRCLYLLRNVPSSWELPADEWGYPSQPVFGELFWENYPARSPLSIEQGYCSQCSENLTRRSFSVWRKL